jgi:hypothetical protein
MAGRPKIISDKDEADKRIDGYITDCEEQDTPVTLTGLCIALGFNSKDTFYNYAKDPAFSDSIKRARLYIENAYEKRLHGNSPTGSIFALKNMDWKDQKDLKGDLTVRDATGLSDAELEAIASGRS